MKAFPRQAMAPLGILAFWCGMLMAARHSPAEYDWRYMTLSSLLSPSRNPSGHLWASAGILLCGLCSCCWTSMLGQRLTIEGTGTLASGIWFLRLGNFFMMCSAVLPSRLLVVRKGHELLVLLAFVGLCIGMVNLTFQTVEQNLLGRTIRSSRPYAVVLSVGAVLPILLAGFVEAYVYFALPQLHWVSLAWRARGVPYFLSFSFWEWITCVVLSAYIAVVPLLATSFVQSPRGRGET